MSSTVWSLLSLLYVIQILRLVHQATEIPPLTLLPPEVRLWHQNQYVPQIGWLIYIVFFQLFLFACLRKPGCKHSHPDDSTTRVLNPSTERYVSPNLVES